VFNKNNEEAEMRRNLLEIVFQRQIVCSCQLSEQVSGSFDRTYRYK